MNDKYFIDTNIFIYSFDIEEKKTKKAKEIIGHSLSSGEGMKSIQVIH